MDVKHEFIKRLHARYGREGIDMPYPTRTLYLAPGTIAGLGEMLSGKITRAIPTNSRPQL
jgi:hypothetical protein